MGCILCMTTGKFTYVYWNIMTIHSLHITSRLQLDILVMYLDIIKRVALQTMNSLASLLNFLTLYNSNSSDHKCAAWKSLSWLRDTRVICYETAIQGALKVNL